MNLFIESHKTEALSALTTAYRTVLAKVEEVERLYAEQKDCMTRQVPHGHRLQDERLRELEVCEIRLSDAAHELFPLVEPLKTAYLAVEAEVAAGDKYSNATRTGMTNVICARELYEKAAALYYAVDLRQNNCISQIGLEREYARAISMPDWRAYSVRFNSQQTFQPPYRNPDEVYALNSWTIGQVSISGEVRNEVTGEVVSEGTICKDFAAFKEANKR